MVCDGVGFRKSGGDGGVVVCEYFHPGFLRGFGYCDGGDGVGGGVWR